MDNFFASHYEIKADSPVIISPSTTARPLIENSRYCLSYLLKVRSLGSATYIGVGDKFSQVYRLKIVGEIFGFYGNPHEVLDLSTVFIISDASDSELEFYYQYKEGM